MARRSPGFLELALEALEEQGLLLLQDAALPSLVALVARGPVRGSWWSHPAGGAIFRAAGALDDHPDVLSTKLVSGKVTFVHRRLWPALIAVGRAREPWQMSGLDREARVLLARVDEEGRASASGKPAAQLERRLLVASRQVHTSSGAHALELSSWEAFARAAGVPLRKRSVERSRAELVSALEALAAGTGGRARLPWAERG
jgi:hypothetical protein